MVSHFHHCLVIHCKIPYLFMYFTVDRHLDRCFFFSFISFMKNMYRGFLWVVTFNFFPLMLSVRNVFYTVTQYTHRHIYLSQIFVMHLGIFYATLFNFFKRCWSTKWLYDQPIHSVEHSIVYFGYVPRSRIAGSSGVNIIKFIRKTKEL